MVKLGADRSLKTLKMGENPIERLVAIGVAMLEGELAQKAGNTDKAVAAFNRANTHGKKKTLTLKLGLRLTDAKRKSAVVAAVVGVS